MTDPILQINTERGWRGGEQQTLHLAGGLAESHRVVVVGIEGGDLVERALCAGLETVTVPSDRGLGGVRALRALVRSMRPRIVHAHASKSHQLARLATVGSGLPLVVTRRVAFALKRGLVARWKYVHGVAAYGAISNAVRDALMKGGLSTVIACTSFHLLPTLLRSMQRHPADLTHLNLPVDAFLVLHAGALTTEKNHELLFRAWSKIRSRHPHAHLLIAGTGDRDAELKQLASSMSLEGVQYKKCVDWKVEVCEISR